MNEFKRIRKTVRRQAVEAGLVRRVVAQTGKSKSTVSRTFAGKIDVPDPRVVATINRVLDELGIERSSAA